MYLVTIENKGNDGEGDGVIGGVSAGRGGMLCYLIFSFHLESGGFFTREENNASDAFTSVKRLGLFRSSSLNQSHNRQNKLKRCFDLVYFASDEQLLLF